jgi:hypothetical protein
MNCMAKFLLALAAATCVAGCSRESDATPAGAPLEDAHDAHGAERATAAARPDGQRWPTDEPLRAGMARIQLAVEQAAAEGKPLPRESATRLAGVVEENVAYIVKNCRLPPEPDAALHGLIGRLMTAAGQLKGDTVASEAGVGELVAILRDYRSTFDDPGTVPVT